MSVEARLRATAAGLALVVALSTGLAVRPPDTVRLEVGAVAGSLLGGWSEPDTTALNREAGALDPPAAVAGSSFRFRTGRPGSQICLPIAPLSGGLRLRLRAMARVRTAVSFHVAGEPAGDLMVLRGPWGYHELEIPERLLSAGRLEATLALRALPMVRVPDAYVGSPELWVADLQATAPAGLGFSTEVRVLLAAVPLAVFAFGLAVGLGARASVVASVGAALAVGLLARATPLPLVVAIPRLLWSALAVGVLTRLGLASQRHVSSRTRAALAVLVAAGILFHGSLAFVPGYNPPDVEIHTRRARDLGAVPLDYQALLRYGSHLPTESQTFGEATAALGEKTLIPYSPLPYVAYYALHRAGIDLHWGMTVLNAVLAMAVAPWLWLAACRLFDPGSAWIATLLFALDLPLWHHLARSHAPAAFGGALSAAALLLLAREADRLEAPRRVLLAGGVLALAALGYSSLAVLLGLFGSVLLALLALDASGLGHSARKGLAGALVLGGALAGVLFYFHYVPGLLGGARTLQAEPDLFPGRTYLIFHNEARQSMMVWAAGFALPLGAGLLAAPFALHRVLPSARPILVAWLGAWALTMLLKEPFFFPRPLRWAKEDQFVSPLLALLIGAAAWSLPRPWTRWGAAAVVIATALWLQAGDFRSHLVGLMP